ncbi:CubicO group peptidase (beta-lactamase class C family) [Flavimobilis soli]|uniref:CubicO group peptidase (Beta-lactamase class C family) n=1 Tax=Flavimobilis soli TaxID=442709 RepID=A0A2A9EGG9_9MICO|nr:serine hydrolase domain-containing protein [Flavimobilis soli]PFG37365.1 CubicO group peptidase (beta-lactamase class C family) [Flavimobilis soli]
MSILSSAAVLVEGPGRSSATYGRWHGPDVPVVWGSVTKLFLAGAVGELVVRGDLTWDTRVSTMLAPVTPTDVTVPPVTVRQLVEHTSGLPRLLPEQMKMVQDPYGPYDDARFDAEILGRLADLRNESLADRAPLYSNLGYALLARAVTVATGKPWIEAVRELVVAPAGVDTAEVFVASGQAPRPRAQARTLRGKAQRDWNPASGPFGGASGLWASPTVMLALLRSALVEGAPLDPRRAPNAWEGAAPRHTVHGAIMRQGGYVVVDTEEQLIALGHVVGGTPGRGSEKAEKLVKAALKRG